MILKASKKKACSIPINGVICGKLCERKNSISHNLETLECIRRKSVNCQRPQYWWIVKSFLVCHPKLGGVLTQKVAPE